MRPPLFLSFKKISPNIYYIFMTFSYCYLNPPKALTILAPQALIVNNTTCEPFCLFFCLLL